MSGAVTGASNKILQVSFPRSGSQFLVDSLKASIGDDLRWCESYQDEIRLDYHNMIKTHDFNLDASVPSGWCHIVQVRHPLDAIPSWFDTQIKFNAVDDTYSAWREWSRNAAVFWSKFIRKWVLNSSPEMVILYYDLMRYPSHHVEHISYLITGRLGHVGLASPLQRPRTTRWEFRYYDEDYFRFLASLCLCEMRILGYEIN